LATTTSSNVISGCAAISFKNHFAYLSNRDTLPPLGFAAALPVSRQRRTQLITELGLTSKCSATSRREAPDLTSSIARSRKSPEYGFGIEFSPANQTAVGRIVHCSTVGNPLRFDHTGIRSNSNSTQGLSFKRSGTSMVIAQESITTSAGTFDTFKIETSYSMRNANDPTKKFDFKLVTWYAPAINHWVKRISTTRSVGNLRDNSSVELVEYGRK
jgi:hypothetical protein